jgi:hypothetical protein
VLRQEKQLLRQKKQRLKGHSTCVLDPGDAGGSVASGEAVARSAKEVGAR